jgi:predicted AAA+ superfamily ATPase
MEVRLHELLDEEPVVMLSGPRSAGKSFTCEQVIAQRQGTVLRLDDPSERRAADADPTGYLARRKDPVLIDEYQHVPELLGAIKADLSRRGTHPGQYLLTGSVRADLAGTTEWLTGRVHRARLYPLAESELGGTPSTWFLQTILDSPLQLRGWRSPRTELSVDYMDRLCRGGYPLAVGRPSTSRHRWFLDHVRDTVLRDAMQHANIRKPDEMLRLLTMLAARTATELKPGALENDLGLDRHTIRGYLEILTGLFLVDEIPAWRSNRSQRIVKAPKLHITDTGMAAALLGIDTDGLRNDLSFSGHLLESFVVAELMKQMSWLQAAPSLHHFREGSGRAEVDIVLEQLDGRVVGVEVKMSSHTKPRDLNGLRRLRDLVGGGWIGGLVLAAVPAAYATDDGLVVAPLSALWSTGS